MRSIIIPCHEAKLEWLEKFLLSASGDVQIVVAATNQHEKMVFEKALKNFTHLPITYFACEEYARQIGVHVNVSGANKGIINVKKFLALHYAMEQKHKHMLCIDSDTTVRTSTNAAMDLAVQNYRYEFYGIPTNEYGYFKMNHASIRLFNQDDIGKISERTAGGKLYTWFFDAPMYEQNDLREFFSYMMDGDINSFFSHLTWDTFDHLIYQYFLLLKRDAQFIDYSQLGMIDLPEFLTQSEWSKISDHFGYTPVWIPLRNCTDETNTHLICHMDRT